MTSDSIHARQGPPGSSGGRSERFCVARTGAASMSTAERLLQKCSPLPDAKYSDLPTTRSASGMRFGDSAQWFQRPESGLVCLCTPCTRLTENHVRRNVPTRWRHSASSKVAPRMTTMAWWSPGDDRESRLRDGLSLPPVRPAAQVAWSSCRPLQAYWSCELSADATSPSTLCVSVPSTGWVNLGWPLRVPACSPGPAPALWAT